MDRPHLVILKVKCESVNASEQAGYQPKVAAAMVARDEAYYCTRDGKPSKTPVEGDLPVMYAETMLQESRSAPVTVDEDEDESFEDA